MFNILDRTSNEAIINKHEVFAMNYHSEIIILKFIIDSYCTVKGMKKFTVEIYFTLIYREMLLILL